MSSFVLVTGGAGFIGSHLIDRLLLDGHHVMAIDDLSNGRLENIKHHLGQRSFQFVHGSLMDTDSVSKAVKGADTILHHAAIVSVVRSTRRPLVANKVNVTGTLRLLECARKNNVERFVLASSAAVYGRAHRPPLDEDMAPIPDSPYGASKSAAEAYCLSYFKTYGLKTITLRYSNVYGPRRSPGMYSGVMMKFAEKMCDGKQPVIFGDGRQTRDFIYVSDVVRANVLVMNHDTLGGEIVNVGTGSATSINALAKAFAGILGFQRLAPSHAPERPGEIRDSYLNVNKARHRLNFNTRTSLKHGLSHFLKWYIDNFPSKRGSAIGRPMAGRDSRSRQFV